MQTAAQEQLQLYGGKSHIGHKNTRMAAEQKTADENFESFLQSELNAVMRNTMAHYARLHGAAIPNPRPIEKPRAQVSREPIVDVDPFDVCTVASLPASRPGKSANINTFHGGATAVAVGPGAAS